MENTIYNILTGIGLSGLFAIVIFYLKIKNIIETDIVKPLIEPLEENIKNLKEELSKKDDKLEKISEIINKNTETLNELKTIFNLIKGKIEINFKEN